MNELKQNAKKECPLDFSVVRNILQQRGLSETEFIRQLFPSYQGQGLGYFESLSWGTFAKLEVMVDALGITVDSLRKRKTEQTLPNVSSSTAGIIGNGNHVRNITISSDLAKENQFLKMQVEMLNKLVASKDETITSKNSELEQLRAFKDSSTALYEKAMAICEQKISS